MNRIFNININYEFNREENPAIPSNQKVTTNYISHVIGLANDKGLADDKRRMFARIMDKLDKVVEAGTDTVELNDYEMVFIKDAFSKAMIPVKEVPIITLIEDKLAEAVIKE